MRQWQLEMIVVSHGKRWEMGNENAYRRLLSPIEFSDLFATNAARLIECVKCGTMEQVQKLIEF